MVDPPVKCLQDRFRRHKIHVCDPKGNDLIPILFPFVAIRTSSLDDCIEVILHGPLLRGLIRIPNRNHKYSIYYYQKNVRDANPRHHRCSNIQVEIIEMSLIE
jgi:hypothetical protein